MRVRRHPGRAAPSTPLRAVAAIVSLVVAGAVAFALLLPAERESGPEPERVRESAARDAANVKGAAAEGRPERRPARRRRPAPVREAPEAPVVPQAAPAPAPAPPAADLPTAEEAPPVESDETPVRADVEPDASPGAPDRGVPEERLLEGTPADPAPAPDQPPAPPAGEPLPARPGETELPAVPPAPAPEQPAVP